MSCIKSTSPNELFSGRNCCLNFPKLKSEYEKYNSKMKRGTDGISRYRHYHNSKESSASTHICIFPSRYSKPIGIPMGLHISSDSSIASESKAYWKQGVVFSPFSALLQSIRRKYLSKVVISTLLWYILYSACMNFISYQIFLY